MTILKSLKKPLPIFSIIFAFTSPAWAQSQTGGTFVGTGSTLHSKAPSGYGEETQKELPLEQRKRSGSATGAYGDSATTGSGVGLYPFENPSHVDDFPPDRNLRGTPK